MYFQKFGSIFLGLSLVAISSFAQIETEIETEVNATYIYLPEIPLIDSTIPTVPIAKKALKVITITPKVETKMKTISQKEYLEYQKLKARVKKN